MKVVCVLKSGGEFGPKHVSVLREMCQQWLPKHEFVCLTDIPERVDCLAIPLVSTDRGWWAKMELFRVFREGEVLFFDLDTIIRGSCTRLLDAVHELPFVVLRDFYRGVNDREAIGSAFMWWKGDQSWLWDAWNERDRSLVFRSDQEFIEYAFEKNGRIPVFWQDVTGDVCSFKADIRDAKNPSFAAVVCFHGNPRPWRQDLVAYPGAQAMVPVGKTETVVVVGNGPAVLSQRLGRVIDGFDQIVRINAFQTHGFEPHVGTRTTLHATHGKSGGRHGETVCPRTLWVHDHMGWPVEESWLVPKEFFWSLVQGEDRSILPSSGYVTVAWLLSHDIPVVHLAGFDHFSKAKSGLHHYWHTSAKRQPVEHNSSRECQIFEQWRVAGRIKYL